MGCWLGRTFQSSCHGICVAVSVGPFGLLIMHTLDLSAGATEVVGNEKVGHGEVNDVGCRRRVCSRGGYIGW